MHLTYNLSFVKKMLSTIIEKRKKKKTILVGSPPVGDFHYWIYVIRKFETVPQEDKEESQNHEWKGNSRLHTITEGHE